MRIRCLLPLIYLTFATSMASGRTIADPVNGYSFNLPDDWSEISAAAIAARVQSVSTSTSLHFVAAFEPALHRISFSLPYIAVQRLDNPPGMELTSVSEAFLQQCVASWTHTSLADVKKHATAEGVVAVRTLSGLSASYSTSPPGFTQDSAMDVANVGLVHDHTMGRFGRDCSICIHYYYMESDAGAQKETISAVAGSFKLDPSKQVPFHDPLTILPSPTAVDRIDIRIPFWVVALVMVVILFLGAIALARRLRSGTEKERKRGEES